jgi:hypothetical protein
MSANLGRRFFGRERRSAGPLRSLLWVGLLPACGGGSTTEASGDASADRVVIDAGPGKRDGHAGDARHMDASLDALHAADTTLTDAKPSDAKRADAESSTVDTNPCLPFVMPSAATLFGSKKNVFAHYFYPFPLSIDDKPSEGDYYNTQYLVPSGENGKHAANGGYLRQRPLSVPVSDASAPWEVDNMEREVRMAMAAGITGFTVDVLSASESAAGSQLQNLLTAAAAVDPRFKIVIMPDMSALGASSTGTAEEMVVETLIESVAKSPAAYHLADGRLVITAFDASLVSISFWTDVVNSLSSAGVTVAFVPTFLGWVGNESTYAPMTYVYGFADWGTATPQAATSAESWPATAHDAGKIFMMPVLTQQYRPKDFIFWEAENSLAFRDSWTSAIAGGADWVQIVTWSDFSESGEIEPYTDITLAGGIGTGFYDLNAYYSAWFLTGQSPTITHDVLYYFYRREPTGAKAPAQDAATTVVVAGGGPAQNNIELLAFLTTPGTLTISVAGQSFTKDAPAGLTSFTAPLAAGTPEFSLSRGGSKTISLEGGVEVYGDGGLPSGTLDLTYWTGSASASGTCDLTVP